MLNTLKCSFKIDITTNVNSFIYLLKHTPLIKNLFKDNLYTSRFIKNICLFISLIYELFKLFFFKIIYFVVIYYISTLVSKNPYSFINIFFFLTLLGAFVNDRLLGISKKRYYSVILMKIDAKKYVLSHLLWNELILFFTNFVILLFWVNILKIPYVYAVLLSLFLMFIKVFGEAFNIFFFKKNKYLAINNMKLYFSLVITIGSLGIILSYISIFINVPFLIIATIISFILGILGLLYIVHVDDYYLIYKRLNNENTINNNYDDNSYSRQSLVEVRNSDLKISAKKIKNKKGYALLNTIFFERHKYLLLTSAKKYALVLLILILGCVTVMTLVPELKILVYQGILKNYTWLVLVMYFINRGAIVTQAMFFNCDHAMLTFNFYREPNAILKLFGERVKTLTKINLIPGVVIAFGVVVLLFYSNNMLFSFEYVLLFAAIILLSIFFSVHYMVIYYLLQPYNKNLQMKSVSYSIVSMLTYVIAYNCTNVDASILIFSISVLVATILYIIVSLILVYKNAPFTFRIKS